jgi:TRAP-type C4-dicarboxylate transport system substrate-binding protein
VKFRTFNSDIQSDTVEALGAVPVSMGLGWINEVNAGRLRGGVSSAWPSTTTTALEKRQATSRTTSYFGRRWSY